jgi:hypothetical protein
MPAQIIVKIVDFFAKVFEKGELVENKNFD